MGCSRGRKDPESLILSVNGSPFLQKAEPNKGNVEDCSMHDPAAPTMNKKFQTRKILRVEHHPLGIFFVCSTLTTEQNYPWEYLRGASRNLFTKGILAGLRPGRWPGTRRGQVGAARDRDTGAGGKRKRPRRGCLCFAASFYFGALELAPSRKPTAKSEEKPHQCKL